MAKIALCGYGSAGKKIGTTEDGYAYVVSDSVRKGDVLQVVATSKANRKFTTTAATRHIYGENTVKGIEAQEAAEENSGEVIRAYRGKELGVSGVSTRKPKDTPDELKELGQTKPQSERTMTVRGGNLSRYMQEHGQVETTPLAQKSLETFEEYAKKFM